MINAKRNAHPDLGARVIVNPVLTARGYFIQSQRDIPELSLENTARHTFQAIKHLTD
jgi:hypothetical protein